MGDDRHHTAAGTGLPAWPVALLAGALAGLALPPLGMPPLLWPALAVLWGLAGDPPGQGPPQPAQAPAQGSQALRSGAAAGRRWDGLAWGMAAVLVSHRWLLWLHPLDWVGVPLPLSLPLCVLLWLGCGLLGGGLVQLWWLLVRRWDASRGATALAGACLWGLTEVLLAQGPLFWIGLGGSALPGDRPLAGLAALGGAGLVAMVQLLLGWSLWRLCWHGRLKGATGLRPWLLLALLLVLGSHGLGLGALAWIEAEGRTEERRPAAAETLLVVQPAIPTRQKFEAAQQRRLLAQLAAAQGRGAALAADGSMVALVLPEGSLAIDQPLPLRAPQEVLSGGFRRQAEELRSSLLRFPPDSRVPLGWIDKHRLVPLGEWVPLASLWRWSGLSAVGGVEPGEPSRLLRRPAGAIGVAICYEIADGRALAGASRAGGLWLLASANLDPYPALLQEQFLALARLRAIENGRWLVAAANTGPSVAVDAIGRVRQRLPTGQPAEALIQVSQRSTLTPYGRWGEGPLLALLLLATAQRLGWFRTRRPPGRPR
jgi:apolipoprotein N-acyltransferase